MLSIRLTPSGRCCRVSGFRHAGGLHDAGGRLLPLARDGERVDGMHRRHLPLRCSLFRFGFTFMFSHGNGLIVTTVLFTGVRPHMRLPAYRPGLLALPVCLCRHVLDRITSGAMIGRTSFVGDLLYSLAVSWLHLSNHRHWAWALTASGNDGERRKIFCLHWGQASTTSPAQNRRTHDRWFHRPSGRYSSGPSARFASSNAMGRPDDAARFDDRRSGWPDSLVRLVWIQSRQHAFGNGPLKGLDGLPPTRRSRRARLV